MEGRRKRTTVREMGVPSQVSLFPNDADAEHLSEAAYLAAEFAVLKAMQGETIRDINNCQSSQSRVTEGGSDTGGQLIRHEE